MTIADCEELIQTEAEQLSEALFDVGYAELPPQLKMCVRTRVISALWPELFDPTFVAAA
jgi:hypothetical protein